MAKDSKPHALSQSQCWIILATAFLGWAFAGVHMSITGLVMRVGVADLAPTGWEEKVIGQWFGFLVCAFLFGAAVGGYVFGFVGDRMGRARAMAISILCYSVFSGVTYFAQSPTQLLVLRFLTCMGIGGMWPNGIALVSEAWPNISRPFLAGAIGTAANVGIFVFALLTVFVHVTPDDWRWTMLVGTSPVVLALFAFFAVPESPKWLDLRDRQTADSSIAGAEKASMYEIFQQPLLKTTLVGIMLGAVPLFGGWGVSNWGTAWASEAGDKPATKADAPAEQPAVAGQPAAKPDPALKSWTVIYRSLPGSFSSLLGGALAFWLGRKRSYLILCVCALICTQILFRAESPHTDTFKYATMGLGFFSGFFFGWLPLCLPEMFPTRVRSTGAGVSFNFGRILTGIGILVSAYALRAMFEGNYATVGQISGFVYVIGMVVIIFAPDTSKSLLEE
ncbi:MAG: MFS transporter [Pirellulaceae bacterium]|jgi:hypothetical protein|nr:MFS transporter [Pirellulaceae bacterium]MDP7019625.1 MFS transporter [Pirellulaceae bacterium]